MVKLGVPPLEFGSGDYPNAEAMAMELLYVVCVRVIG